MVNEQLLNVKFATKTDHSLSLVPTPYPVFLLLSKTISRPLSQEQKVKLGYLLSHMHVVSYHGGIIVFD